jgi:hypothetical protein
MLEKSDTTDDGLGFSSSSSSSSSASYIEGPCIQDDGTTWYPPGYDFSKTVAPESIGDGDQDETDDNIYRPWKRIIQIVCKW